MPSGHSEKNDLRIRKIDKSTAKSQDEKPIRESIRLELPRSSAVFSNQLTSRLRNKTVNKLRQVKESLDYALEKYDCSGTFTVLYSNQANQTRLDCLLQVDVPSSDSSPTFVTGPLKKSFEECFEELDGVLEYGYFNNSVLLTKSVILLEEEKSCLNWGSFWEGFEDSACGDLWSTWRARSDQYFMVCDGVGHGNQARHVSMRALDAMKSCGNKRPDDLVKAADRRLQRSRGAVLFVGRYSEKTGQLDYCSVGNISARIFSPGGSEGLITFNGTVGYNLPVIEAQQIRTEGRRRLLVHTDGIETPPDSLVDEFFLHETPVMNAARIFGQFGKESDDKLVSVVEIQKG